MNLKLVKPNIAFEKEHAEMIQEWRDSGENLVPFVIKDDSSDFPLYVNQLLGYEKGVGISDSFVSHSTFWLVNEANRILGVVNIRHGLTDRLLERGGHIGYGIRPSERRKGNATKILELALLEAKKMGTDKALVTCDKDNIASLKTIEKNNGKLESEVLYDGNVILRYWIEIE